MNSHNTCLEILHKLEVYAALKETLIIRNGITIKTYAKSGIFYINPLKNQEIKGMNA